MAVRQNQQDIDNKSGGKECKQGAGARGKGFSGRRCNACEKCTHKKPKCGRTRKSKCIEGVHQKVLHKIDS